MSRWLLVVVGLVACVPEPSDPVDLGQLCAPATPDCASQNFVYRDSIGRNQIDYVIENTGDTTAFATVTAQLPGGTETDGGLDDVDLDDTGLENTADNLTLVSTTHQIPSGQTAGNRWTTLQLGTTSPIQLTLSCPGCSATLDYVLTSIPLECITDDDCSGGWFCDQTNPGRCIECRSDSDCTIDQRCNLDQGRCTPPDESGGCSTTGQIPILFALLILIAIFHRRRPPRSLVTLLVLLTSLNAFAAPPVATMSAGIGSQLLLGELGQDADPGISLDFAQELRWQFFGAAIHVTAAYFLTDQESPPFSKGLQTYGFRIGPRGFVPVGPIELSYGLDYLRLGVASNSLVQLTGKKTSFHGLSTGVGARYRWSGIEVRLDADWQPILDLPGSILSLHVSFALTPR